MSLEDDYDDYILDIPLYIPLPPRHGIRRQILICVSVELIDEEHVGVGAGWDVVEAPQPYQPGPDILRFRAPRIHGVHVFTPPHILFSPMYIVVTRINDTNLRQRLLVTITIIHWEPHALEDLQVEFDARLMSPSNAANRVSMARVTNALDTLLDYAFSANEQRPEEDQGRSSNRTGISGNSSADFDSTTDNDDADANFVESMLM
ncbi:hypothetical protein OH77DRAFT_1525557 [Trametes cingulata]|nr:hypothetical protein OH77DRAFT_1525557 [Trametes cingulata]